MLLSTVLTKLFIISKDLESILGTSIPLHVFTDSNQLLDAVAKGQKMTERRPMIDVTATRQAYKTY